VRRLDDQEARARADEPSALAQHDLDVPRIAVLAGERAGEGRRLHRREVDDAPLRLGDRLVGEDHHVAVNEGRRTREQ
jgi:hypothetical protein